MLIGDFLKASLYMKLRWSMAHERNRLWGRVEDCGLDSGYQRTGADAGFSKLLIKRPGLGRIKKVRRASNCIRYISGVYWRRFCLHGVVAIQYIRECIATTRYLLTFTLRITRVLAINVSIPNLTVARLEQFRSPQLRIQRQRPTNHPLYEIIMSLSPVRVYLQLM